MHTHMHKNKQISNLMQVYEQMSTCRCIIYSNQSAWVRHVQRQRFCMNMRPCMQCFWRMRFLHLKLHACVCQQLLAATVWQNAKTSAHKPKDIMRAAFRATRSIDRAVEARRIQQIVLFGIVRDTVKGASPNGAHHNNYLQLS